MSTSDKTKAQLLEENGALKAKLDELADRRPTIPVRVPEADALAACIRALDSLKDTRSANLYGSGLSRNSAEERVLRGLAGKYNVPLFETRFEPCARRHLDDIQPFAIQEAVTSALGLNQ